MYLLRISLRLLCLIGKVKRRLRLNLVNSVTVEVEALMAGKE